MKDILLILCLVIGMSIFITLLLFFIRGFPYALYDLIYGGKNENE